MKYVDTMVTFSEVPDEISLAINISGCNIHCPDCHSKYLWDDIGEPLTEEVLDSLIEKNQGITCVCLMGGDNDVPQVMKFFEHIREKYPELKNAWYSGQELKNLKGMIHLEVLDYLKVGPYIKRRGPLTEKFTNQEFFWISHTKAFDSKEGRIREYPILVTYTYKFWKYDENSSNQSGNRES